VRLGGEKTRPPARYGAAGGAVGGADGAAEREIWGEIAALDGNKGRGARATMREEHAVPVGEARDVLRARGGARAAVGGRAAAEGAERGSNMEISSFESPHHEDSVHAYLFVKHALTHKNILYNSCTCTRANA